MTNLRQPEDLDKDAPLTSLTVGEFLEAINFEQRSSHLRAMEDELRAKQKHFQAMEAGAQKIWANVEKLSHGTTPFEVNNLADLQSLTDSIKVAIEGNQSVVVALAIREKT